MVTAAESLFCLPTLLQHFTMFVFGFFCSSRRENRHPRLICILSQYVKCYHLPGDVAVRYIVVTVLLYFVIVSHKITTTPPFSFRRNRWAKCAPLFQDVMR